MPEVIFNGPEGRLEGRFTQNKEPGAEDAEQEQEENSGLN